jgi:hypothetical protein
MRLFTKAIPAALAASMLFGCQAPWSAGERSCADHARLDPPVDLAAFASKGRLWPFGVHGGPSPEGHPGIDFILDGSDLSGIGGTARAAGDIEVKASFSAEILSVTAETEYPGSSCLVMDSACVEVNLCHLRLDAGLKPGVKVKRGQRLGTVGLIAASGRYELHFGTYSGRNADLVCPTEFLDPDTVRCRLGKAAGEGTPENCGNTLDTVTLMGRSAYPETADRELTVACADGSSQVFVLQGETGICAPRLPDADRARMNACLGSACAGIW